MENLMNYKPNVLLLEGLGCSRLALWQVTNDNLQVSTYLKYCGSIKTKNKSSECVYELLHYWQVDKWTIPVFSLTVCLQNPDSRLIQSIGCLSLLIINN